MWEVDPETKSKLLSLQKLSGNTTCVDCSAPSPQWASPKFGTFICLSCAGIHRGLGVHISFVRSISMDSFKIGEVKRMELGGNKAWKDFWMQANGGSEAAWEELDVEGRYSGDIGDEWKERLSAKVEGRDYIPVPKVEKKKLIPRTSTSLSTSRSASPSVGPRKERNESFFAKLGNENASRPADVAPSQGGKYGGFGSEPLPKYEERKGIPGVNELTQDPVAALTKGFGWFTATVGKSAKNVNEGWIQPTAQKIAESDLTAQARLTAAQVAQNVQKSTKGAAEQFNKFVEGEGGFSSPAGRGMQEPEKKDFWDSFGAGGAGEGPKKGSTIGTAAMKGGGAAFGGGGGVGVGGEASAKEDGWEEW